jgi:hypothetical protein
MLKNKCCLYVIIFIPFQSLFVTYLMYFPRSFVDTYQIIIFKAEDTATRPLKHFNLYVSTWCNNPQDFIC